MTNGTQNAPAPTCPIEQTLAVVGKKWSLLIVRDLLSGPRRFGELMRTLTGISTRTLTQRLHELERDGIVHRTLYPEVPPRTEYTLTPRGVALAGILKQIRRWHAGYVEQAA